MTTSDKQVSVRDRFPSLQRIGVAVQHFALLEPQEKEYWHGHDILEMNLILHGECTHTIDNDSFHASPGTLGVIHYGVKHSLAPLDAGAEVINLYLDPLRHRLPEMPADLAPYAAEVVPLHPELAHRQNRLTHLRFSDRRTAAETLRAILREQDRAQIGHEAAMTGLLQAFLIQCGREVKNGGLQPMPVADEWQDMERLRRHLDNTYRDEQSLDQLSEWIQLSRSHLCRRFKTYAGCTILEYVHQRRIHEAMIHLRRSEEKILAVALCCGYNDLAFFNRKFKEVVGCTPREYRRGVLVA